MNTASLHSFSARCVAIGYKVKALFFLRPQADYIESLYAELLIWGLTIPFDPFFDEIARAGKFKHRRNWWFCIDYNILLDSFAEVLGADNIVTRVYRESDNVEQIVIDLLRLLLPNGERDLNSYQFSQARENRGRDFADLVGLFIRNKTTPAEKLMAPGGDRCTLEAPAIFGLSGSFHPLEVTDFLKVSRFFILNLGVQRRYGQLVPLASKHLLARVFKQTAREILRFNLHNPTKREFLSQLSCDPYLFPDVDFEARFEMAANRWQGQINVLDLPVFLDILTFGFGRNRYLQVDLMVHQLPADDFFAALQISWLTERESAFSIYNSRALVLKRGDHSYTFGLPPDAVHRIKVEITNAAAGYRFKRIELRAEADAGK